MESGLVLSVNELRGAEDRDLTTHACGGGEGILTCGFLPPSPLRGTERFLDSKVRPEELPGPAREGE